MTDRTRFEYLKDGQTQPRVSDWQARLLQSREEVLSVLSESVDKTAVRDAVKRLDDLEVDVQATLLALCQSLDHAAARMPLPKGFFVSDTERKPTFAASYWLLERVEEQKTSLQELSLCLSALLEQLAETLLIGERTKMLFSEIGLAAKRNADEEACCFVARLRDSFDAQRENTEQLRARVKAQIEPLRRFCQQTLPDFCKQLTDLADMLHDGEKCNPVGTVRLCGELRTAINHTWMLGG